MQNPLLLDLIEYFTAQGVCQGDGVDGFRDFVPESPDELVAVMEYPGSSVYYDTAVHRSVQILARSKSADSARQKALAAYEALISENLLVTLSDTRTVQASLRQPPYKLKQDNNERVTYCFNVGITTSIY